MTRFLYKQSKMKTNTTQKPKMDAQNERHQKARFDVYSPVYTSQTSCLVAK
jgi:hypothetical protein